MDMNNVNIEEIVKQVLSGMTGNAPAQTAAPAADKVKVSPPPSDFASGTPARIHFRIWISVRRLV